MSINTSIYIMCIAICIIYVHDDVDVSAYEYVNVYADVYASVFDDRYMYITFDSICQARISIFNFHFGIVNINSDFRISIST